MWIQFLFSFIAIFEDIASARCDIKGMFNILKRLLSVDAFMQFHLTFAFVCVEYLEWEGTLLTIRTLADIICAQSKTGTLYNGHQFNSKQ